MIFLAYRNQHYVPQAYLKAWTDLNGKLYAYNKDKTLYKYSKTDNVLHSPNLYTRRAIDKLILTDEDIRIIFGILEEYVIKLNGVVIDSIDECANQYELFNEWEIFNKDGTLAKKKRIKHEIDQAKITTTEHRWDEIENYWLNLKEKVERDITERKGALSNIDLVQIYNFMIAQKWRTPKSIQYYRDLINTQLDSFKDQLGETYEETLDEFSLAHFKKTVMRYQDKDEKSHIIKEIEIIKEYTVVFYLAEAPCVRLVVIGFRYKYS